MVGWEWLLLGFGYKLRWIARSRRLSEEGESEPGKELVFDYLRLSHMIGDGSLLLTRVGERAKEKEDEGETCNVWRLLNFFERLCS